MRRFDFDYLIIGCGLAGRTAALVAVNSGMKVGIVEAENPGGNEINGNELPYLAMSNVAKIYHEANNAQEMGVFGQEISYNYPTILHWKEKVLNKVTEDRQEIEEAGVKYLKGFAHFLDAHRVSVGEAGEVSAKKILIATGGKINTAGITYADNVKLLMPTGVLKLQRLPKSVVVVGGGASGCELAEYLVKLGVKVVLLEKKANLLPTEDQEIGETMANYLRNLGVSVVAKAEVKAVEQTEKRQKIIFDFERKSKFLEAEKVVLATGIVPNTDIGLENAGVEYDKNGIKVNRFMRTRLRHIFAVGAAIQSDSIVNSPEKTAHEAAVAAANMINKGKNIVNYVGMARRVNTDFEVATVGLTEKVCKARKIKYKVATVKANQITRTKIDNSDLNFVKIIVDREKKILGAAMMAPKAGLAIQEISLAMRTGVKILDLAMTPHAMHDYSEMIKIAARELAQ